MFTAACEKVFASKGVVLDEKKASNVQDLKDKAVVGCGAQ